MLKLFSQVLVAVRELSLEHPYVNRLVDKMGRVVSNTCFFILGRPVFTSGFKGIRAPLISSISLESSVISACSEMGNSSIINAKNI